MSTLVRCHTPFFAGDRLVSRGTVLDATDPLLKAVPGRAAFFAPYDPSGVEQTTARPGERRNVTIPPANRRPKPKAKG
jgi:hypothetical protein